MKVKLWFCIVTLFNGILFYDIQAGKKRKTPEDGFDSTIVQEEKKFKTEFRALEKWEKLFRNYIDTENQHGIHFIMGCMARVKNTPLLVAVQPVAYAADKGKIIALKIFIEDYELPCSTGYFSPFHNALIKGHTNVCNYLIKHFSMSVDRPIDCDHGSTPIHIAAEYGHVHLFKMLIAEHKASSLFFDKNGKSAVAVLADPPLMGQEDIAAKKRDMIVSLLKKNIINLYSRITDDGATLYDYALTHKNFGLIHCIELYIGSVKKSYVAELSRPPFTEGKANLAQLLSGRNIIDSSILQYYT